MTRAPATRAAVAGLAALALLTGCGSGDGASPAATEDQEHRVADDQNATTAAIIHAGTAVEIAGVRGRTLITYRVQSESDEGPRQVAWRLYGADGDPIADGRLAGETYEAGVQPAGDGFLLRDVHVALDGVATPIPAPKGTARAEPGDVLLDTGFESARILYRPNRGDYWKLPRVPGGNPQAIRAAANGSVWVAQASPRPGVAPVSWSVTGLPPWHTERIPIGSRSHPLSSGLTVVADRVFLYTSSSGTAESSPIDGLFERSTAPGGTWRRVDLGGTDLGRTLEPRVQVLSDGRLVISDAEEPAYVQDGGDWRKIRVPGRYTVDLRVVGDALYVDRYPRHPLSVSHDEGRNWAAVPR